MRRKKLRSVGGGRLKEKEGPERKGKSDLQGERGGKSGKWMKIQK